jgi:diacylglycerol kinase (ATP)
VFETNILSKAEVFPEQSSGNAKTLVVINPNSASGSTGKNWQEIVSSLESAISSKVEVALTTRAGEATEITRSSLKKGTKRIVSMGGDGTANEVVNGFFDFESGDNLPRLVNSSAAITILPAGTRNVAAKSLDIPTEIDRAIERLSNQSERKLDVIFSRAAKASAIDHDTTKDVARVEANSPQFTNRIVLNAAEVGEGAELGTRAKMIRDVVKIRPISTVASAIATVPAYISNNCEFHFENETRKLESVTMCIAANGKFIGGGLRAAGKADPSDGMLDVVVLKESGSFKMLDELLTSMRSGNYEDEKNVLYRQVRKVSIKPAERDVRVTADGEPIGFLPATFEIIPGAINLLS